MALLLRRGIAAACSLLMAAGCCSTREKPLRDWGQREYAQCIISLAALPVIYQILSSDARSSNGAYIGTCMPSQAAIESDCPRGTFYDEKNRQCVCGTPAAP